MADLPTPITINELRTDMRNIVHRLINGDQFTLTSYSHPVAVLIPIAEYHRLTDTNHTPWHGHDDPSCAYTAGIAAHCTCKTKKEQQ